jgi:hypothetical protein
VEVVKKHLTTITPFSHALTIFLLIALPLLFLYVGLSYYKQSIEMVDQEIEGDKPLPLKDFEKLEEISNNNRLTDLEFRNIQVDLSTVIATESPREALSKLSVLMEQDRRVLKECHGFVHEIGNAAIKKYGDLATALGYQDDLCGSGYIHGVIEEHLINVKDVFSAMKTICQQYGLGVQAGKCYHGIGHGLMFYTENDLPKSIATCSSYQSVEAQTRCVEGVYMENFGTLRNLHPSKYLNAKNTLYPCPEQPEEYKQGCYYYSPLYYLNIHGEDYKGAMRVCFMAEKGYKETCIKGVGSRLMKQHIDEVAFAENTCKTGAEDKFYSCLDGMVSYHLVNFDSVAKTKEMCFLISIPNQEYCLKSVENQRGLASN